MTVLSRALDVYDKANGSVLLAWAQFTPVVPDTYNVYVNGVLNQNVATLQATVGGLAPATYNEGVAVAPSGNSARPQNMPPNGDVTPAGTYDFKVVAVKAGVEIAASLVKRITVQPTSVMLTTPMRRVFPFPNTGLD
jgi:hypothetical protein